MKERRLKTMEQILIDFVRDLSFGQSEYF